MLLRDFLGTRVFTPREPTYMQVDPLVGFAHTIGKDAKPQRFKSQGRIVVPMLQWDTRRENDLIAAVMVQVAASKLYKAKDYAALTPTFWAKLTHYLDGLVLHPDHRGKFDVPQRSKVFYSEAVPKTRLVCLGTPNRVGTYLIKDALRGVFVPHGAGIVGVDLYQAK